ncbi:hypothetical protein FFLO_02301 [Filobasidium floriforme]|uniref:Uncharacterized protein n=1 Tax=Filobasidium floriforme TaxID=5210 RepID=A0A8K0JMS8_9TREE|nr:hypothetical protein FFLO_02301 [Filobasidium floriforme]
MGSLHNYRRWLKNAGFGESDPKKMKGVLEVGDDGKRLSLMGHAIAGMFAGFSNAAFAHPIETIKSKLQLQFSLDALKKPSTASISTPAPVLTPNSTSTGQVRSYTISSASGLHRVPKELFRERYTGPINVVQQTVKVQGLKGMWKGFGATLWFRSSFAVRIPKVRGLSVIKSKLENTPYAMSQGTSNFIAGGMASNAYWAAALPADNVKNRIMSDGLSQPKYKGIWHVVQTILHEKDCSSRSRMGNLLVGGTNFYRGVFPVALRAFPTNAAALTVWEAVMRSFNK